MLTLIGQKECLHENNYINTAVMTRCFAVHVLILQAQNNMKKVLRSKLQVYII